MKQNKTKLPRLAKPGKLSGSMSITHKAKDGTKTVKKQKKTVRQAPRQLSNPLGLAQAGTSMGLTIPGPDGTYMSARVEAWVSLPCDNDVESVRQAMKNSAVLVQEQLAKDAEAVREFFTEM